MRYDSILDTIGRTPIVRIRNLAPAHANLFVKLESFNPMGSVKDRMAAAVIEAAERSGALKPGQTVIEATSGNTGIGLAMVCAAKNYPLVVTMAENFSVERRRLMRFLGAQVVLTPAAQKGSGMLAKAVELAEKHGWFLARQFENEANADIHSKTTALEILEDFEGERLDYWVTAFGTGGTLKGVARVLKAKSPHTRIIVAEADNVPLLASGIAQTRNADGSPRESHPSFRPHPIQGTSPDFISKLTEDAVRAGHIDAIEPVDGGEAMRMARELAQREGIFVGISAGAAFAAALAVARRAEEGANILAMLPDTGERYLSTPLFADISEEMNDAEVEISRSTPSCQFGGSAPPPSPAQPEQIVTSDAVADAFVEATVHDAEAPVVVFALKWCEFCWSLRRMLDAAGIPFRSVDLDEPAFEKEWGGRVRAALQVRTGMATIPQVFVGGEFVGGCTETFDAWRSGKLQTLLTNADVPFDASVRFEPYAFLPKWLQPRAA